MPTSTNIAKYPEGMLDILEAVCDTEKPAVIPYPDDRTAKAERFKFYGLIKALVINRHSLADKAQRLTITLSGDNRKRPNILTIQFPGESTDNAFYQAIAARLNAAGGNQ
jgi:hypothetical protein